MPQVAPGVGVKVCLLLESNVSEIADEVQRVRAEVEALQAQLRVRDAQFEPDLIEARRQNEELVVREAELEQQLAVDPAPAAAAAVAGTPRSKRADRRDFVIIVLQIIAGSIGVLAVASTEPSVTSMILALCAYYVGCVHLARLATAWERQ